MKSKLLPFLCLAACSHSPAVVAPSPPLEVSPPTEPAPSWWSDVVFYEVFVRSFQDSNGDGVGDLPGLLSRLDYLNDGDPSTSTDLGITALWLMPIFESPSYHGYDTTNYYRVDPEYGTEQDLKDLLAACHQRGIRVVLDLMLNHSSSEHPWFLEAAAGGTPREDWYLWSKKDPGWRQPWGGGPTWHKLDNRYYYGIFWRGMPDFNFLNPEVEQEFIQIADHWLTLGVDGFRLDAIRHLVEAGSSAPDVPQTHVILQRMRQTLTSRHPQTLLVGEIWADPAVVAPYYGQANELQLAFNFGQAGAILEAVSHGSSAPLVQAARQTMDVLPVQAFSAPFLTNHDQDRVASRLGGDVARLKLAAGLLLVQPGTPFMYYGEELGLKNSGVGGDEAKRAPMVWDTDVHAGFSSSERPWQKPAGDPAQLAVSKQSSDPGSLLSTYRHLIQMRSEYPGVGAPLVEVGNSPDGTLFHQVSVGSGQVAVVMANLSAEEKQPSPLRLGDLTLQQAGFTGQEILPAQVVYGPSTLNFKRDGESWVITPPVLPPHQLWVVVVGPSPSL